MLVYYLLLGLSFYLFFILLILFFYSFTFTFALFYSSHFYFHCQFYFHCLFYFYSFFLIFFFRFVSFRFFTYTLYSLYFFDLYWHWQNKILASLVCRLSSPLIWWWWVNLLFIVPMTQACRLLSSCLSSTVSKILVCHISTLCLPYRLSVPSPPSLTISSPFTNASSKKYFYTQLPTSLVTIKNQKAFITIKRSK